MRGRAGRGWMVAGLLAGAALVGPAAAAENRTKPSPEVRQVLDAARRGGELAARPLAIVDKRTARLWVYAADGRLAGQTPVLLGQARGDASVPGIGQRPLAQIAPAERTTPAGRFDTQPGVNLDGEAVVWVDYDAGFAIHRLRPGPAHERRAQRLASATPDDNRASFGCVVVPVAFYESVIAATLGRQRGVVYVLPESGDPAAVLARDL